MIHNSARIDVAVHENAVPNSATNAGKPMSVDDAHLFSLGAIVVRGPDAAEFLNGQLSAQVPENSGVAQLTAWNTPKGRVRAVIIAVNRASEWVLLTHPSLQDALAQGLARYVLRARVEIEAAGHQSLALPHGVDGDELRLHIGDLALAFAQAGGEPGLTSAATLAFIEAGVPLIDSTVAERHLPQSLNLDLLAAVAFDKGCYPGQEIIARTQNLGRIKRRLLALNHVGRIPPAGTAIVGPDGEKRGEVVNAAVTDRSEVKLLATLELRALGGALMLEGSDTPLSRAKLPYSVPEIDAGDSDRRR